MTLAEIRARLTSHITWRSKPQYFGTGTNALSHSTHKSKGLPICRQRHRLGSTPIHVHEI